MSQHTLDIFLFLNTNSQEIYNFVGWKNKIMNFTEDRVQLGIPERGAR